MQTSPAVEQIKTLNGPRVRGISPVDGYASAVLTTFRKIFSVTLTFEPLPRKLKPNDQFVTRLWELYKVWFKSFQWLSSSQDLYGYL